MTEKPLHVRVAEALGWEWRVSHSGGCRWLCPPDSDPASDDLPDSPRATGQERICADAYRYVPRYDTDWSATGPLIERLKIDLMRNKHARSGYEWSAGLDLSLGWDDEPLDDMHTTAERPLIAVCGLILALKEAGKLETAEAANK